MDEKHVAVDVKDLTKGMYVSELDRPWLETPFVFQGFEISNQVEIDILRSHCKLVYIDVDRSDLTLAQIEALKAKAPAGSRRARSLVHKKRAPGKWKSRIHESYAAL